MSQCIIINVIVLEWDFFESRVADKESTILCAKFLSFLVQRESFLFGVLEKLPT